MAILPRLGFDRGVMRGVSPVVRWLLVGSLLFGMGMGLRNGWIVLNVEKLSQDLNMPFLNDPEPFKAFEEFLKTGGKEKKEKEAL